MKKIEIKEHCPLGLSKLREIVGDAAVDAVPIDPPKLNFDVGDWVEWGNFDWQVVGFDMDRCIAIERTGGIAKVIYAIDLKRITFRPFESAEEFNTYRERWMKVGEYIVPPIRYGIGTKYGELFARTWHSIHGDDWHGQPCGVREVV